MAKLKKEVWAIDVIGKTGTSANPDIAFGITNNDKPALRLGENIITGSGGGGGASSWDDLEDKPFESVDPNGGFQVVGGVLKLDTTNNATRYDYKPITSHGVYEVVGFATSLLEGI